MHTSWLEVDFNQASPDFPASELLGLSAIGSSLAQKYKNDPLHLNWRLHWEVGKKTGKVDKALASYAPEIKDNAKHEYCAFASKVKTSNAPLTPT